MKTSSFLRVTAAGLAGAVALAVGAGAAGASTASAARVPLAAQKAACNLSIDKRVFALHATETRIGGSTRLTAEQKSSLSGNIDASIAELNGTYRTGINAAQNRTALKSACQSVYVDLRIFAVFLPQVTDTGYLDAIGSWYDSWVQKVDAAHASGTDTTAEQKLLDDAKAKMDDAGTKIASVTPASFNADRVGTRATWDGVRSDLFGALADLQQVRALLAGGSTPVTPSA